MNRRRYRIVNKRKFISFLATLFISIIVIISLFINSKVYSSTYKEIYREVTIKEGHTLWDIAIENMPEQYDVRKMIFEIREFNNMDNVDIYPGDLIKVPIKQDFTQQ